MQYLTHKLVIYSMACLVASQTWAEERLSALGIGVSDLQHSTAFYADVLELEVLRTYELGSLNEVVLGFPDSRGAVLVLMNWPNQQRRYQGNDAVGLANS